MLSFELTREHPQSVTIRLGIATAAAAINRRCGCESQTMMTLLWVWRSGFSTREALDAWHGLKRDCVPGSLIAHGLPQVLPPKDLPAIQAEAYVRPTQSIKPRHVPSRLVAEPRFTDPGAPHGLRSQECDDDSQGSKHPWRLGTDVE